MTNVTTINVERLEPIKAGENPRTKRTWVLYEVFGTDANGTPLTDMRTFDKLPEGEQRVEVEVNKFGATVRKAKPGTEADLLARIEALEAHVEALIQGKP